jgi:hypothetical protein
MTATSISFRRERMRPLEFDPAPARSVVTASERERERPLPFSSATEPFNSATAGRAARDLRVPVYIPTGLGHKTVMELYRLQGGLCFHCRQPMLPTAAQRNDRGWTREHVVPRSEGGKNGRNLVLAHRTCNMKRGTLPLAPHELRIAEQLHDGVPLNRMR